LHESNEVKKVRVNIGGEEYTIKGKVIDPAVISEIAAFVNEKFKEADKMVPSKEKYRIAVLAAFNIAGELFEARQEQALHSNTLKEYQTRTKELSEKLSVL
jgi:cell division protein ZapA (FtsZ GTPase activity inhibitor)